MYYLAFYKRKKGIFDWVIRTVTRSEYSHVEFVADYQGCSGNSKCISSSVRDKGVRTKEIILEEEAWDLVPINFRIKDPTKFLEEHHGKKYDFIGLLWSQCFSMHREMPHKWFCSEICAAALEIPRPAEYAPGDLHELALYLNKIWGRGQIMNQLKPEKAPEYKLHAVAS